MSTLPRPILALLALLAIAAAARLAAAGDPGTVLSHQKLSQLEGGLPNTIETNKQFGWSASSLGDVDGDGVTDVAVGQYFADNVRGVVWVLFLNADGTVKGSVELKHQTNGVPSLDAGDQFGSGVAGIGDLDGDTVPDLAVGARGDDDGGSSAGAAYVVLLKSDGTAKATTKISNNSSAVSGIPANSWFGASVTSVGDIDDDGVTDLAVGAPEDELPSETWGRGAIWVVRLNGDGSAKAAQKISATTGNFGGVLQCHGEFGMGVAGLGDLDGDGVGDVAVGARRNCDGCGSPCSDGQNTGALWIVFLNANGTAKAEQKIAKGGVGGFTGFLDSYDFFGQSLATMDDVDGDGVVDLAVACPQDDDGGSSTVSDRGAIYVMFLNTDGTVHGYQKISDWVGGFTGTLADGDRFGSSVAFLGDLDGNGHGDLLTGATGDDAGAVNAGAAWVLFLDGARFKNLGHALVGAGGEIDLQLSGQLAGNDPVLLDATNAPATASAFLMVSPSPLFQAALGGVIVPDYTLPNTIFAVAMDGVGELHLATTWPTGVPAGFDVFVQLWVADASAPAGWASSDGMRIIAP